jgi:hypothetical protein
VASRVLGTIKKKITSEIMFASYTLHASKEEAQYQIMSDKTNHIAVHKGAALKKIQIRCHIDGAPIEGMKR